MNIRPRRDSPVAQQIRRVSQTKRRVFNRYESKFISGKKKNHTILFRRSLGWIVKNDFGRMIPPPLQVITFWSVKFVETTSNFLWSSHKTEVGTFKDTVLIALCTRASANLLLKFFKLLLKFLEQIRDQSNRTRYSLHPGHFEGVHGFCCLIPNHILQISWSTDK